MILRCGDALTLMREMPEGSVDLIVTDPPYATIGGGNRNTPGRPSGMLASNNGRGGLEIGGMPFTAFMADLFRVLRSPGHAYVFTNTLNLRDALNETVRVGFGIHNVLTARKNNVTPNRWYMKNAEFVLFLRKGPAFPINNIGSSKMCHDWSNPVGRKCHPNEKPVELMRQYVENSSTPGQTVLDPFMGAGSVGVACQETGRSFVGFEIDPVHYATACRRLRRMP